MYTYFNNYSTANCDLKHSRTVKHKTVIRIRITLRICVDLTEHLYKTTDDHFLKLYDNSDRSFVTYSYRLSSK